MIHADVHVSLKPWQNLVNEEDEWQLHMQKYPFIYHVQIRAIQPGEIS